MTTTPREPMPFRIRPLEIPDIPALMEIEQEAFSIPWKEESFYTMLVQENTIFLIAETAVEEDASGGRLLGYVGAFCAGEESDITNVAVCRVARRRGIGRELLQQALRRAEERGVKQVFLEVREKNEPAIALYRSAGFRPVGRRKGYYVDTKEDAVIMRWPGAEDKS